MATRVITHRSVFRNSNIVKLLTESMIRCYCLKQLSTLLKSIFNKMISQTGHICTYPTEINYLTFQHICCFILIIVQLKQCQMIRVQVFWTYLITFDQLNTIYLSWMIAHEWKRPAMSLKTEGEDNKMPGCNFLKVIPYTRISPAVNIILTHWGQVTHICVSKLTIIASDNGLSPDWRQAII